MKCIKKYFLRGFTLTELLAVVIIVSILSSIAAGTYKKAVERSRFNDGLNIATTIQEAADRYTYEHDGTSTVDKNKLDMAFDNMKECSPVSNSCIQTNYFTVTIANGQTNAMRKTGLYQVRVYSGVIGSNTRAEPKCVGKQAQGKNFCISVGYSSCTASGNWYVCSLP